ncbi:MAG: L-fucose isomerase [Fusobacteriaceae bacterium]
MFRLNGKLPKIGIRPTIDGRRNGIRESMEERTMLMAKNLASFIENNMVHPSGEKIECVLSDTTIGGVTEAVRCQQKFKESNVGLTITVTPCWCYGTETIDTTQNIPKAIWGFNGTERPGAVYLAAAVAGHNQMGDPVFSIYGEDVQDKDSTEIPDDVKEKIVRFVRSGIAVATMKDKSYLSIGSVSMGIAGSVIDPNFFSDYLGIRNEYVDMCEIKRRLEKNIFDQEEYKKAMLWTSKNCIEGRDDNKNKLSVEDKKSQWEIVVKMTLIIRDLMVGNKNLVNLGFAEEAEGHNAIASGFQGQRHWTDFMPNGDFSEAILNSSFDWNGIREAYVVATENDSLNGVAMLFGHLLTGRAQIFSDVRTYWSPSSVKRVTGQELSGKAKESGIIHLINSGSTTLDGTGEQSEDGNPIMKQFWDITEEEVDKCLEATKWCPANLGYFRGGGFSSCFLTKGEMPVTMSRINLIKGIGPVLQICEGHVINLDKKIHDLLNERTDPSWPTTWFAPRLTGEGAFVNGYTVMDNWGANHGAISYGHIGADLITLASILRIPVNMHNVDDNHIFRPKLWSSFGTQNREGSDFRACENLGPLYGKIKK